MKIPYLSLCLLFIVHSGFSQIIIPTGRFETDETAKLIVCNQLPSAPEVTSNTITLGSGGKIFTFTSPPGTPSYGKKYSVTNSGQTYALYFTELTLVTITLNDGKTIDNIIRDSDIKGEIAVTDKTGSYLHQFPINIRVRGASSSQFPKKSYRVTLRNPANTSNVNESLLGLRSDRRWLMLAMWNEELKFNNVISHELWRDIHDLYYLDSAPNAIESIRTVYVEAFVNKRYRGVYAFTEDMDEKQLALKSAGGELYKGDSWGGAVTFDKLPPLPSTLPNEYWGGWEYKYPDWTASTWNNLYNFTDFVKNSSNSNFSSEIDSKIDFTSFIDYFLFLNLTFAYDNTGKNTFIARYETGSPYFIIPWDLDGVFGYSWQGVKINRTGEILSNNLYNRLLATNPNDFRNRLASRWKQLRQTHFSEASLFNKLDSKKNYLETNKVYSRDSIVYQSLYTVNTPNYQTGNRDNALVYIKNWLTNRLELLDHYFDPLLTNEPGCDFTVLASPSTSTAPPNSIVTLTASCTGGDCSGISYEWKKKQVDIGSSNPITVTSPSEYGKQTFNLTASKADCPTRLIQTSYIVNNEEPNISVKFSIWTPGAARTKIRDINENDVIPPSELPGAVNWFVTTSNAQITNPSGSNYYNHINFRLNRPEYLNYGFGPEYIVGSDGGPYGIFGREGGEAPTEGRHQIRADLYNGNDLIVSQAVNFVIGSEPLPVSLTNFKVIAEQSTALLQWQTTSEVDNSHFEVQHSSDAKTWSTIGRVERNSEETSTKYYTFYHPRPLPGVNYYRLKMVDLDGSSGLSPIRSIRTDQAWTTFFPNPSQDRIFLGQAHLTSKVEIISMLGNAVMTLTEKFEEGLSVKGLATGHYILRTTDKDGTTKSEKLVVLK